MFILFGSGSSFLKFVANALAEKLNDADGE